MLQHKCIPPLPVGSYELRPPRGPLLLQPTLNALGSGPLLYCGGGHFEITPPLPLALATTEKGSEETSPCTASCISSILKKEKEKKQKKGKVRINTSQTTGPGQTR